MTVPAGTFQAHSAIGNLDDLEDVIYNISPTEFPFMTNADRGKATGVFHEWQTDVLATAVATNAAIEGDDATVLTATPTVRLGNYCQIATKAISVSGTQDAVRKAGRKSELAYQIMKRGKEIKRDIESQLTQNKASSAGGTGTSRTSASIESWLFTNRTDLGTGGSPTTPGFISGTVAAPTDNSTAGTFTEAALKAVIRAVWDQGGDPRVIMVNAFQKTKFSAFAGIATQYRENKGMAQATIVAAADVYISDFGEHRVLPNRFMRTSVALVLDMDYWEVAYLRPFTQFPLAKTGDSEKRQMLAEYTLVSRNEAASGKVTTLTTS
jgi:hypothetical protein